MRKAMELNIRGIKCDHCDFKDEDVKVENYDDWLNKPCPECGKNLLTESDYTNTKILIELAKMTNEMFPNGFDGDESKTDEVGEKIKGIVEMDGSGKMNFKFDGE